MIIHTLQETTFGRIESNSVFFAYPCRPDVNVLQGLSVSVLPGETLALVGASGGGKSTLISLIEKFYHPSAGLITLDGVDIISLDIKWLRSQIGYVPQEPVLFNTTIADNIRYGALFRDVTDEEIVKVAKDCHIHDFIQSLPQVILKRYYLHSIYCLLPLSITLTQLYIINIMLYLRGRVHPKMAYKLFSAFHIHNFRPEVYYDCKKNERH